MAITYNGCCPRPSSQSCVLVSHCSSSPPRAPRRRLSPARASPAPHVRSLPPAPPRLPQSGLQQPLSQRLFPHLESVLGEFFRGQRWPIVMPLPRLLLLAKQLHRPRLHGLGQSPVRPPPPQPVHHRPVAPSFHPPQQLPYPARTDGQLFPRLYLRNMPLPHLMQHLQSIAIFPRHPQLLLSLRHALSKRNFLLGSKRNFSCGCDSAGAPVSRPSRKFRFLAK